MHVWSGLFSENTGIKPGKGHKLYCVTLVKKYLKIFNQFKKVVMLKIAKINIITDGSVIFKDPSKA